MPINRPKTQFIATKNKDGDAIVAEALDDVINQKAGIVNRYTDGTVAERIDVVFCEDVKYVVVNPTYSEGFVFLADIYNPTHFTRKVRIETCKKCVPNADEKRRAIEVLEKIGR